MSDLRAMEQTLDQVFGIAAGDEAYQGSVRRIRRELERLIEKGKGRNKAKIMLSHSEEGSVGFAILVEAPEKMNNWAEVFVEEGWVDEGFSMEEKVMELMYVYVQPKYRRLGKAKRLLVDLLEWAQKEGVEAVYAYVSDRRNVALDFYLANKAEVIYSFDDTELDGVEVSGPGLRSAFLRWRLSK